LDIPWQNLKEILYVEFVEIIVMRVVQQNANITFY
jgi:hypothetical protein